MIITPENWKQCRYPEANRLFAVDGFVQYTRGFATFDENNFGKVTRITDAGIVYVVQAELKEVRRNPVKHPADWQLGGWIEYDSRHASLLEDKVMRFLPNLKMDSDHDGKKWNYTYRIQWNGPKDLPPKHHNERFHELGNYDLRPLVTNKKGIIRATFAGCL